MENQKNKTYLAQRNRPGPKKNGNKNGVSHTGAPMTKIDADIARINATTEKLNLEIAKRKGNVIDKELVKKSLGILQTVIINHIKPLGDRLSVEMAALFEETEQAKIIQAKTIIDKEVSAALASFKTESAKQIKKLK